MALLRSTKTTTVTSPVPHDIASAQLLAFLHRNDELITLSPFAQHARPVDGSPPELASTYDEAAHLYQDVLLPDAAWRAYAVREKIPGYGLTDFLSSQRDAVDGCCTVVHAPKKLHMLLHSRVKDAPGGGRVLEEECVFHGNILYMPFVLWNFKKAHLEMHRRLFKKLRDEPVPKE